MFAVLCGRRRRHTSPFEPADLKPFIREHELYARRSIPLKSERGGHIRIMKFILLCIFFLVPTPGSRVTGCAVKKAVVHSGGKPARELVRSTR